MNPRKTAFLILAFLMLLVSSLTVNAADTLSVQGILRDSDGCPLASGNYNMRFALYDVFSGGTALWSETHSADSAITVTAGLYSARIGTADAFPSDLFSANPDLWLEIATDTSRNGSFEAGEVFTPRVKLDSVPFAHQAQNAVTLAGQQATDLLDKATYDNDDNGIIDGSALPAFETDIEKLIREFTVASGESVSAGDAVVFINDSVRKGSRDPAFGSKVVFNTAATYHKSAIALSATKFVVAYVDKGNSDYGTAMVGDVSGNLITFGSKYEFNSAATYSVSAAALSDTKFVVAYQDSASSNYGTAVVGNVSGNAITFGSEYVFNAASTIDISVTALSDTRFVVAYRDTGGSSYGTAVVGDISGNVIGFGSEYVFNSATTVDPSVGALSANKFVVAYRDASNYGTAILGDVSGNVITYGSEYVFNSDVTHNNSTVVLSSNKFVVTYRDDGNSGYGTAVVGDVSDDVITFGPEYVFKSKSMDTNSVVVLSGLKLVVAYYYSGAGAAVISDLWGKSIAFSSEYLFNADDVDYISATTLSDTKFVIAYADGGNSYYGTALVGEVGIPLGIADANAASGQPVDVIIHGISGHHSSLVPGMTYYALSDGSLTTDRTSTRVGIAISQTELLLDIQR